MSPRWSRDGLHARRLAVDERLVWNAPRAHSSECGLALFDGQPCRGQWRQRAPPAGLIAGEVALNCRFAGGSGLLIRTLVIWRRCRQGSSERK